MRILKFTLTSFFILSVFFVINTFGNTITLDTSFNGTGFSLHSVAMNPEFSLGKSMALQSDGKIIIGGEIVDNSSANDEFVVIRLNADGTLDTSFGNSGIVLTEIDFNSSGGKVLVQTDGKILLAGRSSNDDSYYNFTLIRYNSDGSLDTSFNEVGYVTQTNNNLSSDSVNDLALQSDGKIVLVGTTRQAGAPGNEQNVEVMRFNTDGSIDTTFNKTGILNFGTPNTVEEAHTVTIQEDGKILIGGLYKANFVSFLLMRVNLNGTLDESFGNNGITITSFASYETYVKSLALQSDGKILAGGGGRITRYMTDGNLDTSFGIQGVTDSYTDVGKLKVLDNDKFIVSPRVQVIRLSRYMKDGARDTNFQTIVAGNAFSCVVPYLDIQNDGKILLGGHCSQGDNYQLAVFRLEETHTKRFLDFNGDSATDISVYRPSNGQWWYLYGSETVLAQFGLETDLPVPADFTGDGRTDVAVFRPSNGGWYILSSENGAVTSLQFGTDGDIPVAADYDGDDIADVGVFRPSTNVWYIQKSTGGTLITTFGTAGDKPVPSDYDGDFKTDIAIYRPSNGQWWIQKSSDSSVYAFEFGTSSDMPVQGDYTGDNKTDIAFWRPSTGEWFVLRSEDSSYYSNPFGLSDDLPAPGNYYGDGRYDLTIYRPSTNTWHVQPTGGSYLYRVLGTAGDIPLANTFVP